MQLTLQDIVHFSHLRVNDAAFKLGMGLTNFKKQCRELGVKRWPYRYYKGLQTLYWKAYTPKYAKAVERDLNKFLKDPRNVKISKTTKEFRNLIAKQEWDKRQQCATQEHQEPIDFEHIFDW